MKTPTPMTEMTIRDFFAASALAALIQRNDAMAESMLNANHCKPLTDSIPRAAMVAYDIADAMLAKRAAAMPNSIYWP